MSYTGVFLTIAGSEYYVRADGANEETPDLIGSVRRADDGSLRIQARAEKRNWTFIIPQCRESAYQQLVNDTRPRKRVAIGGDAMSEGTTGATITGVVSITGARYMVDKSNPDGFVREVAIRIQEA